ncbi:MAG: SGNH/GDSL hydrolase family protein [Niabella sp.]
MIRFIKYTGIIITVLVLSSFIAQQKHTIFLLGDSISLYYRPYLIADLKDEFTIQNKSGLAQAFKDMNIPEGANGGDSRMVLSYLKAKIKEPSFEPEAVLLNCGLWDIKRDKVTKKFAVDARNYRTNLEDIYRLLQQKNIPLIWIRTTNVIDSTHAKNHDFYRFHADLVKYNKIADKVMGEHHVPVIDLYTFTRNIGGDNHYIDHVHYDTLIRRQQAAFISGYVKSWSHQDVRQNRIPKQ